MDGQAQSKGEKSETIVFHDAGPWMIVFGAQIVSVKPPSGVNVVPVI
jgi:hypothetical protein